MRFGPLRFAVKIPTQFFGALRSTGWKRTAAWNILAASTLGVIVMCVLLVSISQPGSSLRSDTILFRGSCEFSRYLNIGLHLLVNIISSAVLASSNYFMQILNAPSRHEVDRAHRNLSSLKIGIPSLKNLSFLSNFKRCMWALLLITSLPIHLFFNSSIYETNFKGSSWQLTIAAEPFVHGSPYVLPGASLAPAGSPGPLVYPTPKDYNLEDLYTPGYYLVDYWNESYGFQIEPTDYWGVSSPIRQKVSQISKDALKGERYGRWKRLSSKDCRKEYCYFKPRESYGDAIIVVKAAANTTGWTRAEVYADPQNKLPSWASRMPRDEANSLWFSAECANYDDIRGSLSSGNSPAPGPGTSCAGALGYYWDAFRRGEQQEEKYKNQEDWSILFKNWTGPAKAVEESLGYNNNFSSLDVEYCLADLAPSRKCKVIVANNLIFVIMICVFLKVIVCTVVVGGLSTESLVTPGDALNSFLSEPDSTTRGFGTADIHDLHQLEYRIPYPLTVKRYDEDYRALTCSPQARVWQPKRRRALSAMSRSTWWRAYVPYLTFLALLSYSAVLSYLGNERTFKADFGVQSQSLVIQIGPTSFIGGLILANMAQLLLSWSYIAYNALLTRIHVERELNRYSRSTRPLRVSFPKGEQVVTWRLQLPYGISIPVLIIGVILHWLASNSIFFLIMEGGFWFYAGPHVRDPTVHILDLGNPALASDAVVAVGYSPPAILSSLTLAAILAIMPLIASLYRLPGDMIAGGCNSLVLSAACHGFCPSRHRDPANNPSTVTDEEDNARLVPSSNQDPDEETEQRRSTSPGQESRSPRLDDDRLRQELVKLAQSKLRWGVMPLTPELRDVVNENGQEAMHLGFATEDDFISPPVEGELYL
ncbi:hypothetical protein PG987_012131 [Apiospora arundinis]